MNMQTTNAPGMHTPWMTAMESQLEAYNSIEKLSRIDDPLARRVFHTRGFQVDRTLLKHATPFCWTKETINATLAASKSIPADTEFNSWNLNTSAAWWWFEEPLPFLTVELDGLKEVGVRALCLGWIHHISGQPTLGCSTWCDALNKMPAGMTITPSQTWTWTFNRTLAEVLASGREAYIETYGVDGSKKVAGFSFPAVGVEIFITATEGLSRFLLAGLAWLNQKILVESDGHIERHRRKDFNRQTKQDIRSVKVVSLRRIQRQHTEENMKEVLPGTVEWQCRWTVDGHFRNQACGPGMKEHRLVWISPYIKGPDDKELRIPKQKVYVVNR